MKIQITPLFIKQYIEDLSGKKLDTKSRERELVELRFVAFKLTKYLTRSSLSKIGKIYNRDHATVLHGIKQFDSLEEQIYFKPSKDLFDKCVKEFLALSDEYVVLKNLQTTSELKNEYEQILKRIEEKHRLEVEEYKMEVNKQLEQINNFRLSPIFSKITKLPQDEFKELETRVNAFLQMNACNQKRKARRNRTTIYEAY
jgi:hypothetical protein